MLPPDDETPEQEQPEGEAPTEPEEKPQEDEAESTEDAEPNGEEGEAKEDEGEEKPEGEGGKNEESEPEEKRRRAGGWQRKIERLERQNQILAEQLARNAPPPAATPPKEQTPEEKTAAYLDSLVDQRLAAREAKQREQTVVTEWMRRTDEVRAKYDDFDDVVPGVNIPTASPLAQALLTSEHGPAIMYQLAKSPAELARISALPPLDAAREVGRLEAKLSSVAPPARTTSQTARRPPAPPTTVNGNASSTRSLENLPLSEYKRAYRSGRR